MFCERDVCSSTNTEDRYGVVATWHEDITNGVSEVAHLYRPEGPTRQLGFWPCLPSSPVRRAAQSGHDFKPLWRRAAAAASSLAFPADGHTMSAHGPSRSRLPRQLRIYRSRTILLHTAHAAAPPPVATDAAVRRRRWRHCRHSGRLRQRVARPQLSYCCLQQQEDTSPPRCCRVGLHYQHAHYTRHMGHGSVSAQS